MPVPFMYLRCEEFPEVEVGESVRTKVQTALDWGDCTAESSLTLIGVAEDPRFDEYEALHQVDTEMDAVYNQEDVKRLLVNKRFRAFLNRSEGYWLVRTGKKHARNLFDRLSKDHDDVCVETEDLDLRKLSSVGKTTGAYFGNLKIDKVRTAAVFGTTTVVESEEWNHYSELGDLSVVYMRVMADSGEPMALMVMRHRGVNLMSDRGDRLNLEFVASLQKSIDSLSPTA